MARGRDGDGPGGAAPPGGDVPAIPAIPVIPQAESPSPTGWDPGAGRSPYASRPRPPVTVPPPPGAPGEAWAGGATGGTSTPAVSFALPQLHQAPLDGVAVASVVTGALATGPLALVLGIVGLRRTSRSYRRSPRIATTGIVLGALGTVGWSVVGVLASLGAFAGSGGTPVPGDVAEPVSVHSGLVAAGNCVETLPPQQEVGEVRLVPCDTPHVAQVLSTWEIEEATYPGPEGALKLGAAECEPALQDLGLDSATHLVWWFVPTPAAWDEGERGASCLVRAAGDPLTTDLVN